jgi:hypothetical protein
VSEGRGFGEKRLGGRYTEEGKIGGVDGPGNGEERRRRGPEAKREGGVVVVHFDGRTEEGKETGRGSIGRHPF